MRLAVAVLALRKVGIDDGRARFGDLVITLSAADGPMQVETPAGVYSMSS